jgi:phage baseplate assembly protein W
MSDPLGSDLSCISGLDPTFAVVSGTRIVAEASLRRLTTPRGSLFYARDYGTDIREALLAKLDAAGLAALQKRIEAELEKDDRVLSVRCALAFDARAERLKIRVAGATEAGPFAFTLAASALSVELLPLG